MTARKSGMSQQDLMDKEDPAPAIVSLREQLKAAMSREEELKAQVGSDEALFAYVKDGIKALEPLKPQPMPTPKLRHAPLSAVAIWCDAHSEEMVREEETEGLSKYDWQTFEDRMGRLPEKTVELTNIMRQASDVKVLTLALLGDWFMGEIHPDEVGWGSSKTLPNALPNASRVLAEAIVRVATSFDAVNVIGLVGNHGRTTKKPVTKMTADRNWDYALYLIAQEFTKRCPNVKWTLPKSLIHVTEVEKWKVALTHGDVCKRTHTHPYFGISQAVAKEQQSRRRTDKDFDYMFMGHWHHFGIIEDNIIICPSLIGPNQFSQYRMHARSQARQLLTFWTEKHGMSTMWPINL